MFEVGRDYEVHWLEGGENGPGEVYSTFEVIDWGFPLLKLRQFNSETVINTSSAYFVKAEKVLRDDEKEPFPEIWITPIDGDGTAGDPVKLTTLQP